MSKMVGETQQLKVTATMGDGSVKDVTNAGATYSSSNSVFATVDANGLVTVPAGAYIGGGATITINYGELKKTAYISISKNPLATISSISIDPDPINKASGDQQHLAVIATLSDGSKEHVETEGIVYSSSNTSIATVDTNGLLTISETASVGDTATITASYAGKTATSEVKVSPAYDVTAETLNGEICGHVTDSDGNGVPYVTVHFAYYGEDFKAIPKQNEAITSGTFDVITNADGSYSFVPPADGFYLAFVSYQANSPRESVYCLKQ